MIQRIRAATPLDSVQVKNNNNLSQKMILMMKMFQLPKGIVAARLAEEVRPVTLAGRLQKVSLQLDITGLCCASSIKNYIISKSQEMSSG